MEASDSEAMDDEQGHPLATESNRKDQVPAAAATSSCVTRPATAGANGFVGKHRMAAAVSHLHNQINLIQEELTQLDASGESSLICKELVSGVESIPDPLLPMTQGPTTVEWDRWFRGTQNSRRRWI